MKYFRCIETVRGYKPPSNVEEQLHSLTVEVFGHVVDWKNQSLSDRFKKYKVAYLLSDNWSFFFSFQKQFQKNLDPSYKMDLDF